MGMFPKKGNMRSKTERNFSEEKKCERKPMWLCKKLTKDMKTKKDTYRK